MLWWLHVWGCPANNLFVFSQHNHRLYDIKDRDNNQPIATLPSETGNITAIAFHCEGKWLATGSEDGTIKIWDMR